MDAGRPFPVRAVGDPALPVDAAGPGVPGHAPAGGVPARPDDRGHTRGHGRRHGAGVAICLLPGPGRRRLHDRPRDPALHRRRNPARLAAFPDRRALGRRCRGGARLAADALAGPARHDRDLGIGARCRLGNGADGRCLRRRRPPRCVHAVSARGLRHHHRDAGLADLGQRIGRIAAGCRLVSAGCLAAFAGNRHRGLGRRAACLPPGYSRRDRCWCLSSSVCCCRMREA